MSENKEWLVSWLEELNLLEYLPQLSENQLTTPTLLSQTDKEHLKSIGITKLGHLNRLMKAIDKLSDNSPLTHAQSQPDLLSDGPPVPKRRSVRRTNRHLDTLSVTEDMLLNMTSSPERVPSPLSSSYVSPSPLQMSPSPLQMSPLHMSPSQTSPSPSRMSPTNVKMRGTSLHITSRGSTPSPTHRWETLPTSRGMSPASNSASDLSSGDTKRSYYENVGTPKPRPQSEAITMNKMPPPPPKRTSSRRSLVSEETTSVVSDVPVVPPKNIPLSNYPTSIQPQISSWDELLKGEVSDVDSPTTMPPSIQPKLTPPSYPPPPPPTTESDTSPPIAEHDLAPPPLSELPPDPPTEDVDVPPTILPKLSVPNFTPPAPPLAPPTVPPRVNSKLSTLPTSTSFDNDIQQSSNDPPAPPIPRRTSLNLPPPPPPPPITEEDYPQDMSDDDDEIDREIVKVIQSTESHTSVDDTIIIFNSPESDNLSPLSPQNTGTLRIVQTPSNYGTDDEIIMVSPQPLFEANKPPPSTEQDIPSSESESYMLMDNDTSTAESYMPMENDTSTAESYMPMENDTSTAESYMPMNDDTSTTESYMPMNDDTSTAESYMPMNDDTSTTESYMPIENDISDTDINIATTQSYEAIDTSKPIPSPEYECIDGISNHRQSQLPSTPNRVPPTLPKSYKDHFLESVSLLLQYL